MHRLLVEALDERVVLQCQDTWLVRGACSLASFTPFDCLSLLFSKLENYSLELEDLVVESVHLIFVFEEVVFVNVLDLEFIVLSATCLDAIVVVKDREGMLSWLEATRADG